MKRAIQEKTVDKLLYSSRLVSISCITKVSTVLLFIFTSNLLLAQQSDQKSSPKEQIDKGAKSVSSTAQLVEIEQRIGKLETITGDLKDLSKHVDELKTDLSILESDIGIPKHIVNQRKNTPQISLIDLISNLQNDLDDEEFRLNSFQEQIRVKLAQMKRNNYRAEGIILGLGIFVILSLFLLRNNKPKCSSCESNSVDGLIYMDNDLLTFPMVYLVHENHLPAETFITYATNYFITLFNNIQKIKVKHKIKYPSSKIAVATTKGKVRLENQDFCLAFETKRFQFMVMADGLGGVLHGREAAQIASVSAALSILKRLCINKKIMICDVEKAVRNSFEVASKNLDYIANMLAVKNPNQGFRTTLIIILALPSHYIWGYIGDGGLVILRATGQEERLLIPQKADSQVSNILAASLGPAIEGTPMFGITTRHSGDLVLCGTDGIFDRIPPSFVQDVRRAIIEHNGDLEKVIHLILDELSESKDKFGYVCDDNMSLGIIRDEALAKSLGFLQVKPTTAILK